MRALFEHRTIYSVGSPKVAIPLQQHQNDWGRKHGLFDHLVLRRVMELLFGLNATGRRYRQIFYMAR
jgi:hypothetical protein